MFLESQEKKREIVKVAPTVSIYNLRSLFLLPDCKMHAFIESVMAVSGPAKLAELVTP